MKTLKKALALMLALTVVFAYTAVGAFAATGDQLATPENTITATGVTSGDTVSYYQLVEWKDGNWALTSLGTKCGVTLAALKDGITEAEATTIANALAGEDATGTMTPGTNAYTATEVAAGLYYLKAVPAATNKDTVYNPAFVSADYTEGGNSVDFTTAIGTSTVIKKSTVPFDKEVTGADTYVDTKPGDVIPYKITTKIPSYGTSFTNPVFTVTDTLSTGLALEGDVTVKYGNATTTETVSKVVTITKGTPSNGFTVDFDKEYLTGLNGAATDVEITYSAKVTTAAANNVTYMDNKAKLTFSNTPTTTKDKEDITRHYTFSIDANLNGGNHGNERSRELIKIGVDDNGQTITDFTSWVEGEAWTTYSPLGGATFKLVDAAGNQWTTESTDEGYISFTGLDAGTYTLTEESAPAGYVKDSESHTVVITPTYTENTDILESYKVTVDGNVGSTYTISNRSDTAATVESTVTDGAITFPFVNTKGAELPSTGGIGTTLFYIFGAILVVGAGILLITRRRMQASK